VVIAGDPIVLALLERSVKTVTSTPSPVPPTLVELKFTDPTFAPLTVTFWLAGVKVNPAALGVTV
jgi:hypothetical protein